MSRFRSSISALWNSLMNRAQVVCSVLMSAMPAEIGSCWIASRTSLVTSETSVRSSLDSVSEVLNTFISALSGAHHPGFADTIASKAAPRPTDTITTHCGKSQSMPPDRPRARGGFAAAVRSGGLRVEEVAQPVAQEVETEHGEGDRATGEDGEQWVQGKKVLRLLQHEPPRGIGGLRAEPEVGEGRFGQDRYRKARRRLDDERRERVRQDVPGDETAVASAQRPRGDDELPLAELEKAGARQPGEGRREGGAERVRRRRSLKAPGDRHGERVRRRVDEAQRRGHDQERRDRGAEREREVPQRPSAHRPPQSYRIRGLRIT